MSDLEVYSAWSVGGGRLLCALGPPVRRLSAFALTEVADRLDEAHAAAKDGLWAVGCVNYEAAPAFDASLPVRSGPGSVVPESGEFDVPLLDFQLFDPGQLREVRLNDSARPGDLFGGTGGLTPASQFPILDLSGIEGQPPPAQTPWLDSFDSPSFEAAFAETRRRIEAGEFYQLNLTTRLRCQTDALSFRQSWLWFLMLHRLQPTNNAMYMAAPERRLISLSPELFFKLDEDTRRIVTAPMKGTRKPGDDRQTPLRDSAKDRAENVMIVDLLRNDLARVCEPRSVQVDSLFDVLHLPSVEQMTSSVTGRLRAGLALSDVFRALFPCGSVTGAPKRQAMLGITELEAATRSIYCGATGWISPEGAMQFNVPIRTLEGRPSAFQNQRMDWICGTGSGLTWYSEADAERREWWQKTRFLRQAGRPFQVLETVRLQGDGWHLFERHFARMVRTASRFGFAVDEAALRTELLELAQCHAKENAQRGRWLLSPQGRLQVELAELPDSPAAVDLELASQPLNADPVWILNKTTFRDHYEGVVIHNKGCFDKLLIDAAGGLTETCRFNVVLEIGGTLFTPRMSTSVGGYLLPGVLREQLLGDNTLQERELSINDLKAAARVWLINSLRGWIGVRRVLTEAGECVFESSAHPFDSK